MTTRTGAVARPPVRVNPDSVSFFRCCSVGFHLRRTGVTFVAVLFHRLPDNAFKFLGKPGIQRHRRRRFGVQHRIQGHDHVIAGEGLLPGGHFVEHDAEGKQVGARVKLLAARLLRRHVNRGSGNHAYRGQGVFDRRLFAGGHPLVPQQFGQTKVEDLGLSRGSNKDVGRLDIAMNDALGVGSGKRVRYLYGHLEQVVNVHRACRGCAASGSLPPASPSR